MPKRTDIETILVIGAGPIVIGQAAEFDYSGTQAVKALKKEGYRVVLVNSNPATIMTDPELADATYVEPISKKVLERIIQQEKPDALLPTVGGQTGLNAAVELAEAGILDKYGVEMLGARLDSVRIAEDRQLFQEAMVKVGLSVPNGGMAHSLEEALEIAEGIGRYPILIRPSFTLGGSGGGIATDEEDLIKKVEFGLRESPTTSVLVEESILGWKEFELEVMRDAADNFVVICGIENIDPMGVHTGDSITVAPTMTLTDREYQKMRDQAKCVMHTVGVETGGSNVQFAQNPETGEIIVIEMNPRVSRSSALASKATGFPIAKFAALLAVGYTLDELKNDITQTTVAAFEPSIDYVVTKLPRWAFEKFPGVDPSLGPQMKSVGEAMSIGRTFKESLLKGLQSLELPRPPFPTPEYSEWDGDLASLGELRCERIWKYWEALRAGHTPQEINKATQGVDVWFLTNMQEIVALEHQIAAYRQPEEVPDTLLRQAKRTGFGDKHIAWLLQQEVFPPAPLSEDVSPQDRKLVLDNPTPAQVMAHRQSIGLRPTYHVVDTCAAEFESYTPYLYSSYETQSEAPPTDREKVVILGGGPNRIGQGIEFDYCCVHAAMSLRENGYEAIMINCNPETVSTDYDTSDRLYFEPLTHEHVMEIIQREAPIKGVIVQFGGQTPLRLVHGLREMGVPILGTSPDAIDMAEDRGRFGALLKELEIPSPAWGMAKDMKEAHKIVAEIGYPVLVRPSYVLGGRGMAIVYNDKELDHYAKMAFEAVPGQSVLIDQFLEDSFEIDVDAICDGERVVLGGIMEHIEEAGVHSGDSACVIPPYKISAYHISHIEEYTRKLGKALGVRGLMNVQYAIKDDVTYVIEVNPRASRTVPYVSKATGVPLAKMATRVMAGDRLKDLGLTHQPRVEGFFIKEAVLPFKKFTGINIQLGPEMRSTGEVMGHSYNFGHAFAKAQLAVGDRLPSEGAVFVSVNDLDKSAALKLVKDLHRMGFSIYTTAGTGAFCKKNDVPVVQTIAMEEGEAPLKALFKAGTIDLVLNTSRGEVSHHFGRLLRSEAIRHGIPLMTTLSAAQAAVHGIQQVRDHKVEIQSLQRYYSKLHA